MDSHHLRFDRANFGFWVYLMTDLIMFAALFATFAVLRGNTFGGPTGKELFNLQFAFAETIVLLTSSFTCGLAMLAIKSNNKKLVVTWLIGTLLLGLTFLIMEVNEFSHLIHDGQTPQKSAFLSSYFTLVGTHGLHIAVGLLWLIVSLVMISVRGLKPEVANKLTRFGLFWHFLDIVWIFIFTIVYLMSTQL